jgi:predicted permease
MRKLWATLFRRVLRLLPPDTRADWVDMASTFDAMWSGANGWLGKAAVVARSFGRLPGAVAIEWIDYLGGRKKAGPRRGGDQPMRLTRARSEIAFARNLGFAVRTLVRSPVFSVTSILLVAIGIGSVTAIFTLFDHVLLRPLPYPSADRIFFIDNGDHSGRLLTEMESLSSADAWAAVSMADVNLIGQGEPLRLRQARVNLGFFEVFGMSAAAGRLLLESDFTAANAVVLSAGAWQRIWGGDPSVVGRTLEVDGAPVVVVGVLDSGFSPPEPLVGNRLGQTPDLWRPLDWSVPQLHQDNFRVLSVAARLSDGSSPARLQQELDALMARLAETYPAYREPDTGRPQGKPLVPLAEETVSRVRGSLRLLMGAVALLLLVACANVAHLFMARGLARTREMAVRRAMGAGARALLGELIGESLLVGTVGGLGGALLARLGLNAFLALNPRALPRQAAVEIDLRVLAFAMAASAATSLVFGLLPAARVVKAGLADELRGSGRTATSGRGVKVLRNALVSAEVALSLVLITAAGLLTRSFVAARQQNPGFDLTDVWTIQLKPTEPRTAEDYVALMSGIAESVGAVSGVRSVGYGVTLPLEITGGGTCCWRTGVSPVGRENEKPPAALHPVSAGFFGTLGIDLLAGRVWNEAEGLDDPWPVVLSETLARSLFVEPQAALGQAFEVDLGPDGGPTIEVIGVAPDTRHYGLERDVGNAVYLPIQRLPFAWANAHVAVKVRPGAVTPGLTQDLREAVWSAAPRLPVPIVRSMEEWRAGSVASRRFESTVFTTFGVVALLLAAGGLYGTLLYTVGLERREVGIRLALGAKRRAIEARVVWRGLRLAITGAAIGAGVAWAFARVLTSRLFGVGPHDGATMVTAVLVLLSTAAVAAWLPARRASATDPVETLRQE